MKKPTDTFTAVHDCNSNNDNGAFLNSAHTMCASNILLLVTGPVHSFSISTPFLEYTALAAISALVTNRTHSHLLPGTRLHLSQVKHLKVKCLAQEHNIEIMSQYWKGRNMIFL